MSASPVRDVLIRHTRRTLASRPPGRGLVASKQVVQNQSPIRYTWYQPRTRYRPHGLTGALFDGVKSEAGGWLGRGSETLTLKQLRYKTTDTAGTCSASSGGGLYVGVPQLSVVSGGT